MRELNLIPYDIKQKREARENLIKAVIIGLLAVALLTAAAYVPYDNLRKLNAKEQTLKASLDSTKPIIEENEKLRRETAAYKEHIDLIQKIQKSNISVYPIFRNLEKYMPQDIVITSFSFSEGSINIGASCKAFNSINEFVANLQESKEFTNSAVTNITRSEEAGENTFTLIITNVNGLRIDNP